MSDVVINNMEDTVAIKMFANMFNQFVTIWQLKRTSFSLRCIICIRIIVFFDSLLDALAYI